MSTPELCATQTAHESSHGHSAETATHSPSVGGQTGLALVPTSTPPCDAFARVGLSYDCGGHESEVHHSDSAPIVLSDRPGDGIDLNGRLVRWDAEPGHPTEFEIVVDLGVELLELKTPSPVREAQTQLSRLTDRLDLLADQLAVLQNEQLRQAVIDPATELGRLLADHGIRVLVADGPNAQALEEPLLVELEDDARDTLLLPPGARVSGILEHVRKAIHQREANRAAGRPAWAEPALPSPSRPFRT
ncbi:hypothetical protein [Streptomyces sp. NPDC008092]|uniref:hypothetical protein n=1 Tax=Streptomyces sp. NPDC008092 TaxID=3364808 RepID=UPI0036E0E26C